MGRSNRYPTVILTAVLSLATSAALAVDTTDNTNAGAPAASADLDNGSTTANTADQTTTPNTTDQTTTPDTTSTAAPDTSNTAATDTTNTAPTIDNTTPATEPINPPSTDITTPDNTTPDITTPATDNTATTPDTPTTSGAANVPQTDNDTIDRNDLNTDDHYVPGPFDTTASDNAYIGSTTYGADTSGGLTESGTGASSSIDNSANGTPMTISGKAAGVNLVTRTFWISAADQDYPVAADAASFKYNNEDANINRLLGTPVVTVTGTVRWGELVATSVSVTTTPTVRLETSSFTEQAQPAFESGSLVPYYGGSSNQVASAAENEQTYAGQQTYAAPISSLHRSVLSRHHHHRRHHHRY